MQRDKFTSSSIRADQAWNNSNHSYASINFNNWSEISYDPFGGFAGDILNSLWQARKQGSRSLTRQIPANSTTSYFKHRIWMMTMLRDALKTDIHLAR